MIYYRYVYYASGRTDCMLVLLKLITHIHPFPNQLFLTFSL